MHIFLIGFMAAGKSTVGRLLAEALRRPFVDLDEQIEQLAGQSIADIFEQHGESSFRQLETQALEEVAGRDEACVVATGGGVVMSTINRSHLARTGTTVWLHAPFEQLLRRAKAQVAADSTQTRPLLRDSEAARLLFEQRVAYYREAADHRLDIAAQESAESTALRLQRLVTAAREPVD